jgi:hypothetical protein
MSDAHTTPERQALTEISLICSEALSHGADANGVVEIIEAISAKARPHLDGGPEPTPVKKAILDGEGCIVGVGDTETEARADAFKTVKQSPTAYLVALVDEMMVRDVSLALAAKAERDGGDVPYEICRVNGKHMLVTTEEAAAETGGRP